MLSWMNFPHLRRVDLSWIDTMKEGFRSEVKAIYVTMSTKLAGVAVQIVVMAIFFSVIALVVGFGFLILAHVWIIGRAYRQGFGNGAIVVVVGGSAGGSGRSMSEDDLEKLPSYDYAAAEGSGSPVDCVVCLENLKVGEKCRLLPLCKHSFHAQCVDAWLMRTPICPICRTSAAADSEAGPVVSDGTVDLGGSQTAGSRDLSDVRVDTMENQAIESGLSLS